MARVEIQCPAGEEVHPVLSRNNADVQCRIQGNLRPGRGADGKPAICCDQYTKCPVWQYHVEIDRGPSTKRQRDQAMTGPRRHVLAGDTKRETVRV